MEKARIDLADNRVAEMSRNRTAMATSFIMNAILFLAYLLEVVKGARQIGSFLIIAALCIVPCVVSTVLYFKNNESHAIRYVSGVGFLLFYGYVMFTTTSNMTFCYILVAFSAFLVYVDMKVSVVMGVVSLLINIAYIGKIAMTTGLTPQDITNAEIMVVCVILTCVFSVLSLNKVFKIGQANVEKADLEKSQSEKLLATTLEVANSITESIELAVTETEGLSGAIGLTQRSMEDLTAGTNDTVQAITDQQQSTAEINGHIVNVGTATEQIVSELNSAEDNLNVGHEVMDELLAQVKVSETSSAVVAKEMEGLKENADQMQNIVALISSVARQTSLLALNASIEAARAGEAGRGFAVVAGEISSLAAQTNNATGDINKLIENITLSIAEVTNAMDALLESNSLQNEYVERTAENFNKIHDSNREISNQAEQLKQAVDAVTDANARVVESIDNVSAVTEQVTASATETLSNCNLNMESIEKVMGIMEKLGEDAKKLHQDA